MSSSTIVRLSVSRTLGDLYKGLIYLFRPLNLFQGILKDKKHNMNCLIKTKNISLVILRIALYMRQI